MQAAVVTAFPGSQTHRAPPFSKRQLGPLWNHRLLVCSSSLVLSMPEQAETPPVLPGKRETLAVLIHDAVPTEAHAGVLQHRSQITRHMTIDSGLWVG